MNSSGNPRTALITGATGGLGTGLARRLLGDPGFDAVVLGIRDAERGARLRASLQEEFRGAEVAVASMDLASTASVREAVDRLETTIDAVVLNAGGTGGPDPAALTADGASAIVADNVLGHAALVDALLEKELLEETVEFVGSEAAFGVPALRIPAPEIGDGSVATFSSWIDGSYFREHEFDRGLAYGQAKLLGALWIGALARRHPQLRALTMSPGNTAGTGVNRDLPLPIRLLAPRINSLLGRSHSLETGTGRLADGLLDPAYGGGRFWASAPGKLTGPVVDQSEAHPEIAEAGIQQNADDALHRFLGSATSTGI